jgi:hypothetical protein
MISEYLLSINGMEQVGVISLVISFVCFLYIVFRALRADKRHVETMSRLPLDANDHQPLTREKVQP